KARLPQIASGRIETRNYTVIHDVAWLQQRHDWPGLRRVVMVESTREIAEKIAQNTRFYITSLVWQASQLGPTRFIPRTADDGRLTIRSSKASAADRSMRGQCAYIGKRCIVLHTGRHCKPRAWQASRNVSRVAGSGLLSSMATNQ